MGRLQSGDQVHYPSSHRAQEELEVVRGAFGTATCLGIRSLPNALGPDFRQQLFEKLVEEALAKERERRARQKALITASLRLVDSERASTSENFDQGWSTRRSSCPGGDVPAREVLPHMRCTVPPLSVPISQGQRRPTKYSSYPHLFTVFEYMHSEFERERELRHEERETERQRCIAKETFRVPALPPVLQSTGSFNEFQYTEDPYENIESMHAPDIFRKEDPSKRLAGPFISAGRSPSQEQCKMRSREAVLWLVNRLELDWPMSFLCIVEEAASHGSLVVCFDAEAVKDENEGAVRPYMNELAKNNSTVLEFHIRKDALRWGVIDEDPQQLRFVLTPPWSHVRHPPQEAALKCGVLRPPLRQPVSMHPTYVSSRVPFGPQTASGKPVDTPLRVHARTFKT